MNYIERVIGLPDAIVLKCAVYLFIIDCVFDDVVVFGGGGVARPRTFKTHFTD